MTRVLVVDDEPQILRALAINLRARGYDVATAGTGVQGLDLVGAVGAPGQDEDRHAGPPAEPGDDLGAVEVRQAEV